MAKHQIPGASMAIVHEGRLVYPGGVGLEDRERTERVQPGDAVLTTARVVSGRLATELGGTRVLFDGVAAPLVHASSKQVSAIVPYSVSGKRTVRMEVENRGVRTEPAALDVTEASPALFTANSTGSGPVAAQVFPDARVAVLYATGEGLVDPLPQDGELAVCQPLPAPRLPVKVLLAGQRDMPVVLQVGAARSPDGVTLTLR